MLNHNYLLVRALLLAMENQPENGTELKICWEMNRKGVYDKTESLLLISNVPQKGSDCWEGNIQMKNLVR